MTDLGSLSKAILTIPMKNTPMTYSFDDAMAASLDYFQGDSLAANVFVTKYALQDGGGRYLELTPADMHRRLAREFARIEAKYPNPMSEDEIFELFADWKVVPQGSPMSGVGNPSKIQSFSNCFVVESPYDSYGGILHTDQQLTQIMKRRGGVGVDLSTLRPRGLPTANAAKTTDGLGVFMERFSNTTREVAQGGRRGALMITVSVHHPDVLTFMRIKNELNEHGERTKVTGANVSIRLTDEFLKAVEAGEDVELRWPVDSKDPVVSKKMDARELWDECIKHARDSAEPGLLFWDNVLRESPADCYADVGFRTVCTNPCAELPLSVTDSCRLCVVNVSKFVVNPFTDEARFDYEHFRNVSRKAQRLMDGLVDLELEQIDKIIAKVENDPEPEHVKSVELLLWRRVRKTCTEGRRTGLGVTAIGDTLAMLGVKYGSPESVEVVGALYKNLGVSSYVESVKMAEERGSFPVFDLAKESDHIYLNRIFEAAEEIFPGTREAYEKHGRRQISNLTTAPTGSVSILTQTSGGIEPVFRAQYKRRKKINASDENASVDFVDPNGDKWMEFYVNHHGLKAWMSVTGHTNEDFSKSPYAGAQAEEIDWEARVDVQAAAARWVDHSISSTVNLPSGVSYEAVKSIYERAWKKGLKGITVYRDGARTGVLVSENESKMFSPHDAPKRPESLVCDVHRSRMRDGEDYVDWTIFVGLMDGKPYEIFGGHSENIELPKRVNSGWIVKRKFKSGGKYDFLYGDEDDPSKIKDVVKTFDNPNQGSFTRMLSLSLRHGAAVHHVVEQLQREREADMFSFAKVMARVLRKYVENGTRAGHVCPDCGTEGSLVYAEGCVTCTACGASKCG